MAGPLPELATLYARLAPRVLAIGLEATLRAIPTVDPNEMLSGSAPDSAVLVRLWIDLTHLEHINIYLLPAHTGRALVREVPLGSGIDDVARDQVVEIIAAALVSVRAGMPVGEPTHDVIVPSPLPRRAAAPMPTPTAPPQARTRWIELGVSATADAYERNLAFVPGLGGNALIAVARGYSDLGLWATAHLRFPAGATSNIAGFHLAGGSAEMLFHIGRAVTSHAWARAAAGVSLDLRSLEPMTINNGPPLTNTRAAHELVFAAHFAVRWEAMLGASSVLCAGIGISVPPFQGRYSVNAADGRKIVFAPWPVLPSVALGLAWRTRVASPHD